MTNWRLLAPYVFIALAISLPFTIIHLVANPDDAPISSLQHVTAAVANYFGPWGVAIVRLVDFPNAGLRSFRWTLAISLTLIGAAILVLAPRTSKRPLKILLGIAWSLFVVVWFGVGLRQIADGLL